MSVRKKMKDKGFEFVGWRCNSVFRESWFFRAFLFSSRFKFTGLLSVTYWYHLLSAILLFPRHLSNQTPSCSSCPFWASLLPLLLMVFLEFLRSDPASLSETYKFLTTWRQCPLKLNRELRGASFKRLCGASSKRLFSVEEFLTQCDWTVLFLSLLSRLLLLPGSQNISYLKC